MGGPSPWSQILARPQPLPLPRYFLIERGKNMCGLAACASFPIPLVWAPAAMTGQWRKRGPGSRGPKILPWRTCWETTPNPWPCTLPGNPEKTGRWIPRSNKPAHVFCYRSHHQPRALHVVSHSSIPCGQGIFFLPRRAAFHIGEKLHCLLCGLLINLQWAPPEPGLCCGLGSGSVSRPSPKREAPGGGWLSGWKDGMQGCWCSYLLGGGPWMKEQICLTFWACGEGGGNTPGSGREWPQPTGSVKKPFSPHGFPMLSFLLPAHLSHPLGWPLCLPYQPLPSPDPPATSTIPTCVCGASGPWGAGSAAWVGAVCPIGHTFLTRKAFQTSLAVQWIRLHSQCRVVGSSPGRGTKIPHAAWRAKEKSFHVIYSSCIHNYPNVEITTFIIWQKWRKCGLCIWRNVVQT